jgi:hypothetical protein
MDVGAAFVAEASELVQPGDGALDVLSERAQALVLVGAAAGQDRPDAPDVQADLAGVRVICLVGHDRIGSATRSPDTAGNSP